MGSNPASPTIVRVWSPGGRRARRRPYGQSSSLDAIDGLTTLHHVLVVEVDLALAQGTDERAPGGAITVALCGSWNHSGPCRWPHRTDIDAARSPALMRTTVTVDSGDVPEVLGRIRAALDDDRWTVLREAVHTTQTEPGSEPDGAT